jgi:hypothetical protein
MDTPGESDPAIASGTVSGNSLELVNLEDNLTNEYYFLFVSAVSGSGITGDPAVYRFRIYLNDFDINFPAMSLADTVTAEGSESYIIPNTGAIENIIGHDLYIDNDGVFAINADVPLRPSRYWDNPASI